MNTLSFIMLLFLYLYSVGYVTTRFTTLDLFQEWFFGYIPYYGIVLVIFLKFIGL